MRNVLIIDDDADVRSLVKRMLEREKIYAVRCASSCAEGLEIANGGGIDVIVLDFSMPEMNGLEFLQSEEGFALSRHVPVILLTGVGMSDEETRQAMEYAEGYLSKPVDRDKLLYAIETMLVRSDKDETDKGGAGSSWRLV